MPSLHEIRTEVWCVPDDGLCSSLGSDPFPCSGHRSDNSVFSLASRSIVQGFEFGPDASWMKIVASTDQATITIIDEKGKRVGIVNDACQHEIPDSGLYC